jgi:16S rRNA (guanine527-N7)-methyltransferase
MWNILRRLCHHACFCQRMNLTAVTERSAMMNRHIADSLSLIPMIEEAYTTHNFASTRSGSLKVIDVGSGAGLPGLVLAISCPAWQVTLLESLQKRCDFLEHVIKTVGLPNVQIVHSRAEVRQLLMEHYLLLCC